MIANATIKKAANVTVVVIATLSALIAFDQNMGELKQHLDSDMKQFDVGASCLSAPYPTAPLQSIADDAWRIYLQREHSAHMQQRARRQTYEGGNGGGGSCG